MPASADHAAPLSALSFARCFPQSPSLCRSMSTFAHCQLPSIWREQIPTCRQNRWPRPRCPHPASCRRPCCRRRRLPPPGSCETHPAGTNDSRDLERRLKHSWPKWLANKIEGHRGDTACVGRLSHQPIRKNGEGYHRRRVVNQNRGWRGDCSVS